MARLLLVLLLLFPAPSLALDTPVPVPIPAATATADKYPTIGRTRSKRYCAVETERTNGAIVVALTNDKIISTGIARLRGANLDRPDVTIIDREKVMRDLRSIAAAIQTNLRAGDAQLTDLRALSIKEPDATRSPEIKVFADQLEDALSRQRTVGADLAKMLTIVDGRYARAQGALLAASVMPETQHEHVTNGLMSIDQRASYEPLNQLFTDVADEFGDRAVAIGTAEDKAAVHAPRQLAAANR